MLMKLCCLKPPKYLKVKHVSDKKYTAYCQNTLITLCINVSYRFGYDTLCTNLTP